MPSWSVSTKRRPRARNSRVGESISVPSANGPSAPGEYPHADTGKLRQSIFWHVDRKEKSLIVGSPLDYAFYLETGTRRMAARPFLRQTVNGQTKSVRRIIEKGR